MKTLYTENKGKHTFSGEIIETENDKNLMLIDRWNHDEVKSEIPVGINMLLIRTMEAHLNICKTHIKAKRK